LAAEKLAERDGLHVSRETASLWRRLLGLDRFFETSPAAPEWS